MVAFKTSLIHLTLYFIKYDCGHVAWWRNGSASDSRSEGCVFKSRPGHSFLLESLLISFLLLYCYMWICITVNNIYYVLSRKTLLFLLFSVLVFVCEQILLTVVSTNYYCKNLSDFHILNALHKSRMQRSKLKLWA